MIVVIAPASAWQTISDHDNLHVDGSFRAFPAAVFLSSLLSGWHVNPSGLDHRDAIHRIKPVMACVVNLSAAILALGHGYLV
jgi:hypothetical protein